MLFFFLIVCSCVMRGAESMGGGGVWTVIQVNMLLL